MPVLYALRLLAELFLVATLVAFSSAMAVLRSVVNLALPRTSASAPPEPALLGRRLLPVHALLPVPPSFSFFSFSLLPSAWAAERRLAARGAR